jgi:ketosteroid isomerase-like protein
MTITQDAQVRDWLDRLAIQDLIFRYSDAVTRGDYEQMATIFAPDAVWESPLLGMHFDTAAAFIEMQIQGSGSLEVLIQTPHSPVIELEGDRRARVTTTIHERIRGVAGDAASTLGDAGAELNVDQYGTYYDEVVEVDGTWKFAHRLFVPFLIATGTVTGDVVTSRRLERPTPR